MEIPADFWDAMKRKGLIRVNIFDKNADFLTRR
jgi:hypothetical protein